MCLLVCKCFCAYVHVYIHVNVCLETEVQGALSSPPYFWDTVSQWVWSAKIQLICQWYQGALCLHLLVLHLQVQMFSTTVSFDVGERDLYSDLQPFSKHFIHLSSPTEFILVELPMPFSFNYYLIRLLKNEWVNNFGMLYHTNFTMLF